MSAVPSVVHSVSWQLLHSSSVVPQWVTAVVWAACLLSETHALLVLLFEVSALVSAHCHHPQHAVVAQTLTLTAAALCVLAGVLLLGFADYGLTFVLAVLLLATLAVAHNIFAPEGVITSVTSAFALAAFCFFVSSKAVASVVWRIVINRLISPLVCILWYPMLGARGMFLLVFLYSIAELRLEHRFYQGFLLMIGEALYLRIFYKNSETTR
jgi:hypothetical protein